MLFTHNASNGKRDFPSTVSLDDAVDIVHSNCNIEEDVRELLEFYWRIGQTFPLDDIGSAIIPQNNNPEKPPSRVSEVLGVFSVNDATVIENDHADRKRYRLTLSPHSDGDIAKLIYVPDQLDPAMAQPIDHYGMDERDIHLEWQNKPWCIDDELCGSYQPTCLDISPEDFGC